ncbi:MAG: DUF992 domain-containing protein [Reyranella sp.]|uniref:hypothetical protein n=1 Tax=Reyranella sp. TaxID=1929291 RepID=UPI003D11D8D4
MNAKEGGTLYAVETPQGFLVGEQSTVAASTQAGGNWLYGGPNAEIGMVAAGVVRDTGYNLATGVAEISLRLKR